MKKTAVITGGTRGIGLAAARKLGSLGCSIVIFASGAQEKYQQTFDVLTGMGIDWIYVRGSLDNSDDRKRLVEEAVKRYGRIDILVNDAGVAPKERRDLLEMSEESFDRVMGINLKGTMFLTQLVAKQMIAQEKIFTLKGHIVNVGSCSAAVSSVNRGEYCISKAGVSMITTLFADRLAPEGIVVNEVRPGVIATDMTAKVKEKYDRMFAGDQFPIARWGRPEEVAEAIAFFCSDAVTYTTGNYLDVDGGFHIRRL